MLRRLALSALLITALAACASEEPRGGGRHGGGPRGEGFRGGPEGRGPGGGPQRAKLFISPSGEPFHGDNGLAAWFAQADTDHDGSVSEAEFDADAQRFFKTLDKNHDGKLDGFEIQAYEHDVVPEIGTVDLLEPMAEGAPRRMGGGGGAGGGGRRGGGGGGGRRGGGGGGQGQGQEGQGQAAQPTDLTTRAPAGREGAARYSLLNEPEPVANADADVDGQVTAEEWKRATARRFAHLDRNHTGKLILSDLLLPPDAKKPLPPQQPAPSH
jgi:hypothetical protein